MTTQGRLEQEESDTNLRTGASLGAVVNSLARAIVELDPGHRAQLRRLDPAQPVAPAFWWLMMVVVAPERESISPLEARRWAHVLSSMALAAGHHERGRKLGEVLARAGFAEGRFERLLRCNEDTLWPYLRRAVGFLVAKGIPFDQLQLAELILTWDPEKRSELRLRLAESYYREFYSSNPPR